MNDRDLTPSDAVERYLQRYEGEHSPKTIRSYSNRLAHFLEWCEEEAIESMAAIDGWKIDEYYHWRARQTEAQATLKGSMSALTQLLKYCVDIDVSEEHVPNRVPTVRLSKDEARSDLRLDTDRASALLAFYRDSTEWYGTSEHVTLEVLWHTGCRLGGLRALDRKDFDRDAQTLFFHNRTDTDTRLKNNEDGERIVGINDETADALAFWIERDRPETADEYGRDPLISTTHGRASGSTIRAYSYLGTQPCMYRECPHGRNRSQCKYRERNHASKCPSSRSPHAIRTGSITWQLGELDEIEDVAARVNCAPSTIRRYYDVATPEEQFADRRKGVGTSLDVLGGTDDG